jgi:hypothetical protein
VPKVFSLSGFNIHLLSKCTETNLCQCVGSGIGTKFLLYSMSWYFFCCTVWADISFVPLICYVIWVRVSYILWYDFFFTHIKICVYILCIWYTYISYLIFCNVCKHAKHWINLKVISRLLKCMIINFTKDFTVREFFSLLYSFKK